MQTVIDILKIALLFVCLMAIAWLVPEIDYTVRAIRADGEKLQQDIEAFRQIERTVAADLDALKPLIEEAGKSGKVPIKLLAEPSAK